MPKQFTPAPRKDVLEVAENMDTVHDSAPLGPGVNVVYDANHTDSKNFNNLVEKFGWYVAEYYPRNDGDRAVLMPITEVDV